MTALPLTSIVGPRIPHGATPGARVRYAIPSLLLIAAAVMLLISSFQPYWAMKLYAPQYPKGLRVTAYLTHLTGDTQEINELNHYIGMLPLEEGGKLERATATGMIVVLGLLLVAAVFVHSRWAALLALPAVLFPLVFVIDLQCWLYYFGHHLDPHAALSSSIKPFTPQVLGRGLIGQFRTIARAQDGLQLAVLAAVVVLVALYFHRRAYKPLVDARGKSSRTGPHTAPKDAPKNAVEVQA